MSANEYIDDFSHLKECLYEGERYSVRDNGAVYKHPAENKRARPTDNQWTFGKPNKQTGYLTLGKAKIHRIVATAFHGQPSGSGYVVDHIDTNKHNNRPENLRWVTRLENLLLNPITAKRIKLVCGCSVEEFLQDPSKYKGMFREPNYQWMATVSKEEAQHSLHRLLAWAKSEQVSAGGSLGDWIYKRPTLERQQLTEIFGNDVIDSPEVVPNMPDTIKSKTQNAAQRHWRTPSVFPCCPQGAFLADPLGAYMENLKKDALFCENEIYSSTVLKSTFSADGKALFVMCNPLTMAKITFENDLFVHESKGSFYDEMEAEEYFRLAQGPEWKSGTTLDYC